LDLSDPPPSEPPGLPPPLFESLEEDECELLDEALDFSEEAFGDDGLGILASRF
jgi:hypothetical protein